MFRLLMGFACLIGSANLLVSAEEPTKKDQVRELKNEGLKLGEAGGKATQPTAITSKEELTKAIADEKSRESLLKQVDFEKEQLLFFSWSGSGQDKISYTIVTEKLSEVSFKITYGLTRDFRPHQHLFVLPKTATWKVAGK